MAMLERDYATAEKILSDVPWEALQAQGRKVTAR
jgi:hypothetical protein